MTLEEMVIEEAALRVRLALPNGVRFSREPLRRYETGKVQEWFASFVILQALAHVYGCRMEEVAPSFTTFDEGNRMSGWICDLAAAG